jgi:hypothetical protein
MSEIDPIQFGRLLNSVETLTEQVAELDKKVDTLNGQITGGKGVIMGLLITAGGVGAGLTKAIEKITS